MAIKKHNSSKAQQALNTVKNELEKCIKVQNLPEAILQQIYSLKNDVSSFNIQTLSQTPQELRGQIATQEDVLSIIKDMSEYSKWSLSDTSWDAAEKEDKLDWIKKEYNVTFDETNVQYYFVSRNMHGNSVSVVEVITLPGYFQVSYQASSVGWSEKNLLNLKEFKSAISANVE